ncbi:hypothetical protein HDV05_007776 [Chytridiales sp. JEL 0842]|nr:hypothetical protein HDV05_007776 [Chytridiales sp. JEL 0842]
MSKLDKIIVTYADEFQIWPQISDDILSRLPLRSVIWPNGRTQSGQRVIDTVEIELKPFKADMFPRAIPGAATPFFLHLYFVNCDDHDIYKSTVKKQIQEWLNVIEKKKNQEWLIVYTANLDPRKVPPRFLNVGGSVMDKIKADYCPKPDKFLHLKLLPTKDPDTWSEFFQRLKDCLISSFTKQVAQYEDDTRRLDAQRLKPGWNYCQYFEGLACTFELMNIPDEALVQYDELEAAYFQNLLEQGAPWFNTFGGNEALDDSRDVLNISQKPYRDAILQNTVTIFDFRIYLFARQAQLLMKLDNGHFEICQRGKAFIASFARTIKEYKVSLVPYFGESWIYSTCINIISHCDELAAVANAGSPLVESYEALKGELLLYARYQLDFLGVASGLYKGTVHTTVAEAIPGPNSFAPPGEVDSTFDASHSFSQLSNPDILKALTNSEEYDALYMVGLFYFFRLRYAAAADIWEQLSGALAGNGWLAFDSIIIEKLSICQKELGKLTKFVDACLQVLANTRLTDNSAQLNLVDQVSEYARKMEESLMLRQSSIFSISVQKVTSTIEDDGGIVLYVDVHCALPQSIEVDEIQISLRDSESTDVSCKVSKIRVVSGHNSIRLVSEKIAIGGIYTAERAILYLGKVQFLYDLSKQSSLKRNVLKVAKPFVPIDVQLTPPPKVMYGSKWSGIYVKIITRATSISSGYVKIVPISSIAVDTPNLVSFRITKVNNESDQIAREMTTVTVDDKIALPSCNEYEAIHFTLPFGISTEDRLEAKKFIVEYTTNDGKHRAFNDIRSLRLTAPITLATKAVPDTTGNIVALSVTNELDTPIEVIRHGLATNSTGLATELQPSLQPVIFTKQQHSYIYKSDFVSTMDSTATMKDDQGLTQNCHFNLEYVVLREEMELYLQQEILKLLQYANKAQYSGYALSVNHHHIVPSIDTELFVIRGSVELPWNTAKSFEDVLYENPVENIAGDIIQIFCDKIPTLSLNDLRMNYRRSAHSLLMAVPIEQVKINLSTELSWTQLNRKAPMEKPCFIELGDSIECKLLLNPVLWNVGETSVNCVVEILCDTSHWLISGHKKGIVTIDKEKGQSVSFSLIAIQTGAVPLPRYNIESMANHGLQFVGLTSEQIVVRPKISSKLII